MTDRRRHRRPFFAAVVMAVICGGATHAASPEVRTAQGRIIGESVDGLRIYRGIPYAAPPIGALRWRDPQPAASWNGVRDAAHFGPRCMQAAGNPGANARSAVAAELPISEDCLYLNVWTPATRPRERLPVLVWLHGGAFLIGTGALYDGASLARHGLVVVTINYRLGAFGHFAHPALTAESDHHASGNYAFADSLAALEWVRHNIAAFGGDAEQVTVAGQSAGGRLIQSLRTSQCAGHLFRRAIIESAPVRISPPPRLAEAERDGSAAADKAAAVSLDELRALSAQRVLETFPSGQPTIDGHCIRQDPLWALQSGSSHDIDLLVGSNADEGTFPFLRAQGNRNYGLGFTTTDDFLAYVRERFGADSAAFQGLYPTNRDGGLEPAQREAFRDEAAWVARFSAVTHARRRGGHAFLYYFSHRPPAPATGTDRGATHGAEISYAFDTPAPNWSPEDHRVAEITSAYWANFVAHGDPNGPSLPAWPDFAAEAERMNLGPMSPEPALDAARVAIFDGLYRRVIAGQRSGE